MSKPHKGLFAALEDAGMIEYGAVIEAGFVRETIGLEYPDVATKKEFDHLALAELAAIDYVRNILLGRGMYLSQHKDGYRILLPSENARQVELYVSSADKKLNRALKLARNTPVKPARRHDASQIEARILMKKLGARAAA